MADRINAVYGTAILNANGKPTVEAALVTENGIRVSASVPSGTSRGKYEAFELYDGGERFDGYGTRKAAANISGEINGAVRGLEVTEQEQIDQVLCQLDGTPNKARLGGNAILAVSVAVARAGAISQGMPLYRYISQGKRKMRMPNLIATVIAGGVFSNSGMEFEDYMYVFDGFKDFPSQVEALVSLRKTLEKNLRKRYGNFLEDGGALAAPCSSSEEAFSWMLETARQKGYENKVFLGLDVAASELFDSTAGLYELQDGRRKTKEELLDYYVELCEKNPLILIEDGFDQDDWESFAIMRQKLPNIEIVGDDLFVTNYQRLRTGIQEGSANAVLLKINQIGTVSEALRTNDLAVQNGYDVIVALRSGETGDDFIADLAVGIGARQIKLGSPVRQERNAKYNRLLKISSEIQI